MTLVNAKIAIVVSLKRGFGRWQSCSGCSFGYGSGLQTDSDLAIRVRAGARDGASAKVGAGAGAELQRLGNPALRGSSALGCLNDCLGVGVGGTEALQI